MVKIAYIPKSARERNSNMELLRIVAMSMILVGHFFVHGFEHSLRLTDTYRALAPLHICGVNLFFLIPGWFGIRFSLRSFVKLIGITFFFVALNIFILFLCGKEIGGKLIIDLFIFPVSRGNYWFIMVYLALMIISPLLNAGMEYLDKRRFNSFMVLLSLFMLYSCALGGNYVNVNGYTIMQGIWLYLVAAWLRRLGPLTDRIPVWGWILGFLVCSAGTAIVYVLTGKMSMLNYNMPFVVLASVCFFMIFTRIDFKSRVINAIAPAAFGCYLLQDGLFGRNLIYPWMGKTFLYFDGLYAGLNEALLITAWLLGMLLAYWICSWLLTPIANAFGQWLGNLADRLNARIRRSKLISRLKY